MKHFEMKKLAQNISEVLILFPFKTPWKFTVWPSIKDVGIFLAVFDTPLPHVGILTLIYLIST